MQNDLFFNIRDGITFQPQHLSTVITASPVDSASMSVAGATASISGTAPPCCSPAAMASVKEGEFVVRMRGVPWDVTAYDLIKFVEPVTTITAADIHIVTNYDVS